ncbi:Lcl C-terminal domain-containing protein [Paralcaligenes ginsengisoli]
MEGGFLSGMFRIGNDTHGLVVAPKDLGELKGKWNSTYSDVPGAKSYCDGLANTEAMAAAGSSLARNILALSIDGFGDWYLASRDELELMYRFLKPSAYENVCTFRDGDNPSSSPVGYPYTKTNPAQTSVPEFRKGGTQAFEDDWYVTSTQYSPGGAWVQGFGDGDQNVDNEDDTCRARAVRRFKI